MVDDRQAALMSRLGKSLQDTPITHDLVLLGGGHAHVHVIRSFGMKPMAGVRITIISKDIDTPYSGMLPGYIAGFYSNDDCHIDLRPLAQFAHARLIHDEAAGIDRDGRRVLFRSRPPIAYDVLSIDVGATPKIAKYEGADRYGTAVKPITGLARRWDKIIERVRKSHGPLSFVVVGGGAAGAELILAARHRLRRLRIETGGDPDALQFTLLTRGELLGGQPPSARRMFREIMRKDGVALHERCAVAGADERAVHSEDGRSFAYDELLWVTEAGAASWLQDTGLELDSAGFIAIDEHLRSVNTADVFAVGDCATSIVDPRPKAGVFAVRQGPPLEENLRRALRGEALRAFHPQKNFLCIISAGDRHAVATRGGFAMQGRRVWQWKDHIDRTWMAKAKQIPATVAMPAARQVEPSHEAASALMRCGGCGAKVGASSLSRVIERLSPKPAAGGLVTLDRRDDAAVVAPPAGKMLVQTVDFFRSFISDPYLFGRIAATHALGDIYAMGGEPLTALATAVVPYARPSKVEEDLYQILRGGLDVLEAEGCALVGGHSAEGAELALGFAINGAVDPARILRKGGMEAGDALILTKPLGTGALLAAEMRGQAKAAWIDAALAAMQQSNRAASQIAQACGAHAMTDVTGFGLAGHAHEMASASGVEVEIDLANVPALPGTIEVLERGIASTLAPENERVFEAVANSERYSGDARMRLLADPQTAGGLLIAVPGSAACDCLERLISSEYCSATIIGRARAAPTSSARLVLRDDKD